MSSQNMHLEWAAWADIVYTHTWIYDNVPRYIWMASTKTWITLSRCNLFDSDFQESVRHVITHLLGPHVSDKKMTSYLTRRVPFSSFAIVCPGIPVQGQYSYGEHTGIRRNCICMTWTELFTCKAIIIDQKTPPHGNALFSTFIRPNQNVF